MAPPTIHDDADDLSDLDDLLDEFSAPSKPSPSSSSSKPSAGVPTASSPSAATTKDAAPPASPSFTAEDAADPDDEALPDDLADLDPQLAKDLEEGMKALFQGLNPGDKKRGEGAQGEGEGELDEAEFRKVMEELMRGDGAGLGGLGGAGGEGDDEGLGALMAALGMGGAAGGASATGGKGKAPTTSSSSAPPPPAQPANFQDAIRASMSKLSSSSATASSASAAQQQSSSGGAEAGMASMLAQLAGMPDLGEGFDGNEEGLQGMLDEMMKQLMSREMLYEPLKELSEKYPSYLSSNRSTLPAADLARYEKQQVIVQSIVAKFEEPGADKPVGKGTKEEEERREKRTEEVVDLVAKMNECGAPPSEIMGEMPPGMELGADGVPKMPECVVM
ncbi:hypothetical protein JCM11251_003585 [Rhodosporidiobolus azoricus]